jgi:hypothetical protein
MSFIQTETMLGLFKKKNPAKKLQKRYEALMKEAYHLSKSDRTASDRKTAEAEEVLKELEALN